MLMEHRLYITRMETLIPNGNYEDHADHVLIYKNTNAYYKNQRKTNIWKDSWDRLSASTMSHENIQ